MVEDESYSDFSKAQENSVETFELRSRMYHTLMPFKVGEILIVSSLYDAFIIEEEGLISELLIGQYRHFLLSSPPHVTRVYSGEKALSKLKENHYDLVITMSKHIGMDPYDFGEKIKKLRPNLPIVLLATDTTDVALAQEKDIKKGIDKVFFWTGDSALFLTIIKYVEDTINARYDTANGNVRVLIMLEDSIHHYSTFLPIIYTEIVQQTRRSLSEDLNEMQRLLRRRARPKILLAQTFEEGMALYNQYKEYVLGVFTDINFKHKEKLDPEAGYKFVQQIKQDSKYLPILMQSSEAENKTKAEAMGAYFLDKNSPTIVQDFQHFLLNHLGFGDFVFLLPKMKQKRRKTTASVETIHNETIEIARASDMQEFEQTLQKIPLESIQFHADRNDFSNWLMCRSEFKLAMKLRPKKSKDFTNLKEVREHLVKVFHESRKEKQLGAITDFDQQNFEFDSSFTRIRGDSLGGKGRGIAFMRSLLVRYNLEKKYPDINITIPSTVVIGTLEFDRFVSDNNLIEFANREDLSDNEIAKAFLEGKICDELKDNLAKVLQHFKSPLAVRSSSLLEDSQSRPFAGIYSTYMLPNSHKNEAVRLSQICQAIKLVYASVFFKEARAYLKSTSSKIEEEKMAVVIQEVVGNDYGGRVYPTFSGVAQSYNFYPVGHQTFEDGIVSVAAGLGKTVVGGEKVLRFSPSYPGIIPEFSSPELILENSQRELYVLDTSKSNFILSEKDDSTLMKPNIDDIKKDGTLEFIASTYDRNDRMIRDSMPDEGPALITFSGVLKYDAFPLAPLVKDILDIGKRGMGCPIEIEFAVNFDKENKKTPTFAILQLRPLVPSHEHCEIIWDENTNRENVFIHSDKALGNGVVKSIRNIVYVPPETFDPSKTIEIADEIGKMNEILLTSSLPYILIGPGRWGTEDRWLGIPVKWSQISGVRVMVETALEGFNIKPSQGTHFFHNITSRGIGYINVPFKSKDFFIDWKWLDKQKTVNELKFVKHVQLSHHLKIKFDGRSGSALIVKPGKS
jgi:response regulator RpfG family c-di-GMP phosphodiesterase